MRQFVRLGVAVLLSVSCSPAVAPQTLETPALAPASTARQAQPTAEPTPDRRQEQVLQDKLEGALAYVSQIRQLPAKSAVRGRLIGRSEIQTYISAQLDEETPPDLLQATEALLYGLGTVDADFDYRASVIALMSSQLLGFYDPKQKTFFVGGDLAGDEADVTLWHELVHALQDQHYDLSKLTDWQPDLGDSQAAVHSLAEGDATVLDAYEKVYGRDCAEAAPRIEHAQVLNADLIRRMRDMGVVACIQPAGSPARKMYATGGRFTRWMPLASCVVFQLCVCP